MSLRFKTIFFAILITLLTFAAFYFTSSRLVVTAFQRLEDQNTRNSINTVLNGVNNQFLEMQSLAMTYSPWINSFSFTSTPSQNSSEMDQFTRDNFNNMQFHQNDIQIVLFFNKNNQLVYSKQFINKSGNRQLTFNISHTVQVNAARFLDFQQSHAFKQGILQTSLGPLLIISNPIIKTGTDHRINGTFVIGRFFNTNVISSLSKNVNLPIHMVNAYQIALPKDMESLQSNAIYHARYWTVDYGYKLTKAYLEIPDIQGTPALVLLLQSNNSYLTRGKNVLTYFSWFLAILSVVYGVFIIAYFNSSIVRRIRRFFQVIHSIRIQNDLDTRIPVKGHDEIALLGSEFNNLMNELSQSQKIIRYQAYHDSLTGLYNRNEYKVLITKSCVENSKFFLVILDIDQFKHVNDTFGQQVGDQLLIEIAHRIEKVVDQTGIISRLGGDEFSVLLRETEMDKAQLISYAILEQLSLPYQVGEYTISITVSIGVSRFPEDGMREEVLMRRAERNMLAMKQQEFSKSLLFSIDAWEQISRRIRLEEDLKVAINNNQIYAVYQPKVNTFTEQLEGMEALMRWHHPELGEISPAEFIPIAEQTGLIMELGHWILKRACKDLMTWNQTDGNPLRMAVNLSSLQLADRNLPHIIGKIIKETGINPNKLELEITESVVMKNVSDALVILKTLRDMGLEISIDDFGTGYSSLSYLKEFPVNYIKIDQSFIRDLDTHPLSENIVKGIIELSHGLQFKVVAEGVETREQFEKLRTMQCDEIQGYLFGRPMKKESYMD